LQTFVVQKHRKLILGMSGVWPPEISIMHYLRIQFFLN